MSVINSQPLIGASGNQGGVYNLTRSLRFRSSATAYLNRTPASAGNRRTWTWSGWVKRGGLGSTATLIAGTSNSANEVITALRFRTDNCLELVSYNVSFTTQLVTTQVFRDPSAWYHIVAHYDTTQATASNRAKIYVNGQQVTTLSTASYPSQNYDAFINTTGPHGIGSLSFGGSFVEFFDGYQTEVNFIDGQALDASSFGETSATTGVWIPKKYTGTYGTNGFYLPFTNTASTSTLGNDFSGNSNTWTVNNVSLTAGTTYDSMTDVPTLTSATAANYCVMNPNYVTSTQVKPTISNGNLTLSVGGSDAYGQSTFAMPRTGKYYWEVSYNSTSLLTTTGIATSTTTNGTTYVSNGQVYVLGVLQGGTVAAWSNGDVIGMAINMDANTVAFYRNNTLQTTVTAYSGTVDIFIASYLGGGGTGSISYNYGQRPFTYTPPTGFVALNTFNLP